MRVKATIVTQNGKEIVMHIDWDSREAVRKFAEYANMALEHGCSVTTKREE